LSEQTYYKGPFAARAAALVARYPKTKSAILPLAHLAQDQDGWVSTEAMEAIAQLVSVTPAEVQGTVSFYTMFKREPVGKYLVSVCTNVSCLVLGGPELLDRLSEDFADDDDVTVEEVECLAACDGAPCMQVNYEYHLNLAPDTGKAIVDEYKSGARRARTISGSPT
jgi:NADH-quinone oxidoreductase subunit E